MNARHFMRAAIFVLVMSPALVHAQIFTRGSSDLQPIGLGVERDCSIVVTIRNNGPSTVPDGAYNTSPPGSSVQLFVGGASWGGAPLGVVDPTKVSQPAGGTVSFTWFSGFALPPGSHPVTVVVDSGNTIFENTETNNSLTQNLTCQQDLPDLQAVDLTLDADCRIDVTFRNNGPLDVPESGYALPGGGDLVMYRNGAPFGGVALGVADPAPHASQPAGGTKVYKWFSSLPVPNGSHTVKLSIDTANAIAESNEGNNTIEKVLTCQRPLPDLVPIDITVQPTGPFINSPCKIMLTVANIGPGAVPDAAYFFPNQGVVPILQMWRNGAGLSGTSLRGWDQVKGTQPAGAIFTSPWMSPVPNIFLEPGEHILQIEVDRNNALVELNEANNTLTKKVTCGIQIQPPLP